MKRIYLIIIPLMVVFMFSACGNTPGNSPTADENHPSADVTADSDNSENNENNDGSAVTGKTTDSGAATGIAADKLPEFDMESPYAIDLGALNTTTIAGDAFTGENFAAYDLTMINIWATWCGPCVSELPELAEVYTEYEAKGVNLVGFLLDDDLAAAEKLLSDSQATYPCIVSDGDLLGSLEQTVQFVPTTIFVDSAGKIVGGYLISSRNFESWSAVLDDMLAAVQG